MKYGCIKHCMVVVTPKDGSIKTWLTNLKMPSDKPHFENIIIYQRTTDNWLILVKIFILLWEFIFSAKGPENKLWLRKLSTTRTGLPVRVNYHSN